MKTIRRIMLCGTALILCIISCSKVELQNVEQKENQQPKLSSAISQAESLLATDIGALRVMSYNIHHGLNRDDRDSLAAMANLIVVSGAEVVVLQEVDSVCTSTGNVDQMLKLKQLTGFGYYAFARHFGGYFGGSYGVGILSKYPLSNVVNNRLPYVSGGTTSTRAMISAIVSHPSGRKVLVASGHLSSDDLNAQATEAINIFRGYGNMPIFFGGDMNSLMGSAPINTIETMFENTDPTGQYTFPVGVPTKKIDYIFVSKAHRDQIPYYHVFPYKYSDHFAIITDVQLKNQVFTDGNLLVERYGNGGALTGNTTAIYVDEYNPSNIEAAPLRTINVPTANSGLNRSLTGIGNSTHEGLMTLSRDEKSVSLIGYNLSANVAVPSPIATRVVGLITPDGVINTSTSTSTDIGSTRCVTSIDGSGFWMVGSAGNLRYKSMGANATGGADLGGASGSRSVFLFNNNERLYLSTTVTGYRIARVGSAATPPKSGTQTLSNFPGYPTTTTSPNQFVMFDTGSNNTPDILYVADDAAGQVLKYTYSSSSWVAQGSVAVPNIKSITGRIVSGTVTLYVTTIGTPSLLRKITNASGSTLTGATVTTIKTAPSNTVFKSVAFAPVY